jgi:hypothetical protein
LPSYGEPYAGGAVFGVNEVSDKQTTIPPHDDLIIHCIGIAALEIRKIVDPQRRERVARNAAAALEDATNG